MSLPRGLIAAVLSLCLIVVGAPAAAAQAPGGPASGMCTMNTFRGAVPYDYIVDACVDGTTIRLRNPNKLVAVFQAGGDVGKAERSAIDFGLAAILTRLVYSDPLIVLPTDTTKVPIGPGAAYVLALTDSKADEVGGFYYWALFVQTIVPLGSLDKYKDAYGVLTRLIKALAKAFEDYRDCLNRGDWLWQLSCRADHVKAVLGALSFEDLRIILGAINLVLKKILDAAVFESYVFSLPSQAKTMVQAQHRLDQAAIASKPSTTPPTTPSKAAGSPAVRLLETIQEGPCLYTVKFLLTNFNPGSEIYVSDAHSYTWCDTGAEGRQEWTVRANGVVQPDGSLIWGYKQTVPMHSTHRLSFKDNAGNAATITVTCSNSNVVCAVI